MTYFRDSTDPAYREYCLNAKEVASHYGLSGAQVLYQWVGHYIEETQIMRKTKDFTDEEFKAMTPQEQFQELKRLKKALLSWKRFAARLTTI